MAKLAGPQSTYWLTAMRGFILGVFLCLLAKDTVAGNAWYWIAIDAVVVVSLVGLLVLARPREKERKQRVSA